MTAAAPLQGLRDRAVGIVATGTVLAILYLARDVLLPITLAVILSLLLSPLVRTLRRYGFGATSSVLAAVLALAVACASMGAVLGVQVARMAASLPQYEDTIRHKLSMLDEIATARVNQFTEPAGRIFRERDAARARDAAPTAATPATRDSAPAAPIAVELHQPEASSLQVVEKVITTLWIPLETTGIVLVVLVFVLLEHETLRNRFIRIAGAADLREMTFALNDAHERLSRFFVSQFAVNLGLGLAVWIGLSIIGLPHALLWGALAAALRFVPYVGVWIAALFSALLAAAVDPGWSLAIATLALFVIVELIAGQLIEPQLYGHATGMSPLSVVIAAIFWSWIWGPVGLIVSTPVTLALVVAGRHIKALSVLDLLLGDSQALTMPQRFYQRALSGDSEEIIASARGFLKNNSFAAYCDLVVMPALHLAFLDLEQGTINHEQQIKVRGTIVNVIEAIAGGSPRAARRRNEDSVLDQMNAGRLLRLHRELLSGRWQGSLSVPAGSVVLCVSLGSMSDDLATELLVRILRDLRIDARHVSLEDIRQPPPDASAAIVAMIFIVSAYPNEERLGAEAASAEIRRRFSSPLAAVLLPGTLLQGAGASESIPGTDRAAASFGEAVHICLEWLQDRGNNWVREA